MMNLLSHYRKASVGLVSILAVGVLAGCGDDSTSGPDNTTITVPTAYTFESRFDAGQSSVGYSGQVVRNLLIQDLQTAITNMSKPGAAALTLNDLLAIYEHDDAANMMTLTSTGSLPALEEQYNKISTGKKLSDKISSQVLPGYDKTADQLIREWLQIIANNAQNPDRLGTPLVYTTAEGVDLSQMINKLLLGSVAYYQGTGVYLEGILGDNNNDRDGSAAHTAMEHHWDEAFGYFGAARDYGRYSDEDLAGSTDQFVFDSNDDGKIDFDSEYNYAFARGAGKRDNGRSTDFSTTIFDAFLEGRAIITGKGPETDLVAQRKIVRETWERIIAATVIHYINEVIADMEDLTPDSTPENSLDLNKHWAEMRGYALALYYNPARKISDTDMQVFQGYLETAPVHAPEQAIEHSQYRSRLGLARTILQNAYGFSGSDVNNW